MNVKRWHLYLYSHFQGLLQFPEVLKGQYEIGEIAYKQGTYHFIHHKVTHGPFTSKTGAEILVIWD